LIVERDENGEWHFRAAEGWLLGESGEIEEDPVWHWLHEQERTEDEERMWEMEEAEEEEPFMPGRDAEEPNSTFRRSRIRWQVHESRVAYGTQPQEAGFQQRDVSAETFCGGGARTQRRWRQAREEVVRVVSACGRADAPARRPP
jgi:hypothetical protein